MLAQKQALEERNAQLREELREHRIAKLEVEGPMGPRPVPPGQPRHEGEVVHVDADGSYIAFSLDAEDGVRVGFRYTVWRGQSYVGTVEVTTVRATSSVAKPIRSLEKSGIQVGDRVRSP